MKPTIVVAVLLLTAAAVLFFAKKKMGEHSLRTDPPFPPVDPLPPGGRGGGGQRGERPVDPPEWVKMKRIRLLDLEMVLEWFQANKSRLERAAPSVVGIVLRINRDLHSETSQLTADLLPEVELLSGDVLVGFYNKETKKIQKRYTLALYRPEQISADLNDQFGKKDLLIIE